MDKKQTIHYEYVEEDFLIGKLMEIREQEFTFWYFDATGKWDDALDVVEYQELPPETFGDRVADTFRGSLEFVKNFGQGIVLVVVAVAPFVVVYGGIAAIVVVGIVLIVKLCRKRKKGKK